MRFWSCLVLGLLLLQGCASDGVQDDAPPRSPQQPEIRSEPDVVPLPSALPQGPLVPEVEPGPDISILGRPSGAEAAPAASPPPRRDAYVRIGFLAPLSGPSQAIGQALANAAQLALFDVANQAYVLQFYDTRGTPDGAAGAAAQAIAEGAEIILGPLFSASTEAVVAQARAANVAVLSFSTDVSLARPGVYVMGFLVHEQVREVVNYARQSGLTRFAALIPDTPYGRLVDAAYRQIVFETGGEIVDIGYYGGDMDALDAVVRRIADYGNRRAALMRQRNELETRDDDVSRRALARLERVDTLGDAPYDALLLPEGGNRLIEVAALLPFYDIDPARVQIMGTMLWEQPGLGREPALVGGWYPAPPVSTRSVFERRYRAAYGEAPPSIASHGYDAVALTAILGGSAEAAPFTPERLTNPSGFIGMDGIFRLLPSGRAERRFSILEVTPNGVQELAPAPTTFQAVQF